MLPSPETCRRWTRRTFVRRPGRAVAGTVLCFAIAAVALLDGQGGAARLFGVLGGVFLAIYAVANLIVWRAGGLDE